MKPIDELWYIKYLEQIKRDEEQGIVHNTYGSEEAFHWVYDYTDKLKNKK